MTNTKQTCLLQIRLTKLNQVCGFVVSSSLALLVCDGICIAHCLLDHSKLSTPTGSFMGFRSHASFTCLIYLAQSCLFICLLPLHWVTSQIWWYGGLTRLCALAEILCEDVESVPFGGNKKNLKYYRDIDIFTWHQYNK